MKNILQKDKKFLIGVVLVGSFVVLSGAVYANLPESDSEDLSVDSPGPAYLRWTNVDASHKLKFNRTRDLVRENSLNSPEKSSKRENSKRNFSKKIVEMERLGR